MPKILVKKEDWIELGYKLFAELGDTGINVEKMARILKVNKSSFYWHFKTRKIFIEQLIMSWQNNETERIINLTNEKKTGRQKIKTLIALIYKKDPYLDFVFYLKRYAREQEEIQNIIDDIDKKRIEYANKLLQEIGYSRQEAKVKAAILHKHFIGYHETIRYKEQPNDYLKGVLTELKQIIEL